MTASALYSGKVIHIRHKPVHHRLDYRIFMGLFDLDELPQLDRSTRGFSYNRPGLIAFRDSDHGDGSGAPLRPQVEAALAEAGLPIPGGPIRLLCMPRILGYLFNPLSVYFCHAPNGQVESIVHEVNNTFGGRHFYALPANQASGERIHQDCDKDFRVSPFLPMELGYRFMIDPPGDRTQVGIAVDSKSGPMLYASFFGERLPFTSRALLGQWLRHPLMTYKAIAGIHWEALLLWLKLKRHNAENPSPATGGGARA